MTAHTAWLVTYYVTKELSFGQHYKMAYSLYGPPYSEQWVVQPCFIYWTIYISAAWKIFLFSDPGHSASWKIVFPFYVDGGLDDWFVYSETGPKWSPSSQK